MPDDSVAIPDLDIIYRDERLLVVNKPAGMIVHRGWDNDAVTVADIVRDRLVGSPAFALHRLDRGTSGVLIFALDAECARFMQSELQAGRVVKKYLALVRGPLRARYVLNHGVPKKPGGPRIWAITDFLPLQHIDRWSLVEAQPQTGRLHQIRRHLKHLSHPIVGDVRYGKGQINRFFKEAYDLNRMALHAYEIGITHPSGMQLCLRAAIPLDLALPLQNMGFAW